MALILLCEAFNCVYFVLRDASIQVSGNAHAECSGPGGKNVNPEFVVEAITHMQLKRIAPGSLEKTPCVSIGRGYILGISPLLTQSQAPSESVEMTRGGVRLRKAQDDEQLFACFRPVDMSALTAVGRKRHVRD